MFKISGTEVVQKGTEGDQVVVPKVTPMHIIVIAV